MDEFSTRSQAEYQRALKRFPYPLEIVHGGEALAAYERLKEVGRGVPIVLGGPSEFTIVDELLAAGLRDQPPLEQILLQAEEIDFPAGLRGDLWGNAAAPDVSEFVQGDWPPEAPVGDSGLTVAHTLYGEPLPRVHIATLPTLDVTEAPAHLRAGGWNQCPDAAIMVSALRYWRDRFGAELIGFTHDTMNIRAQIGPASREDALTLALEQQLFCNEMLNHCTLTELAAYLMAEDWWTFWWD